MKIIGITGSIGMGKSTVARQFSLLGVKVCSSDAIVHRLLGKGGAAVLEVAHYFPSTHISGAIDRKALAAIVFASDEKRLLLEQIIHPRVAQEEEIYISRCKAKGVKLVALDIPLLFETGAQARCDIVVVASAPAMIQRRRVLARKGMSETRLRAILARQMTDHEKCARADYVVETGLGKAYSMRQVKTIYAEIYGA